MGSLAVVRTEIFQRVVRFEVSKQHADQPTKLATAPNNVKTNKRTWNPCPSQLPPTQCTHFHVMVMVGAGLALAAPTHAPASA